MTEGILAHPMLGLGGCRRGLGSARHQQCQRGRSTHRLWCLGAWVNVAQDQRRLMLVVCWGALMLGPWCRCGLMPVALPVPACPCTAITSPQPSWALPCTSCRGGWSQGYLEQLGGLQAGAGSRCGDSSAGSSFGHPSALGCLLLLCRDPIPGQSEKLGCTRDSSCSSILHWPLILLPPTGGSG